MENGLGETLGIGGDCSELRELFLQRTGSQRSDQLLQVEMQGRYGRFKKEAEKTRIFRKEKLAKDHLRGGREVEDG